MWEAALSVCLVLSPKLSLDANLAKMVVAEAQVIWTVLGVGLRPVPRADEGCHRVVVVKADGEARPEDVSHDAALAWVPFVSGSARQLVFLRVTRARQFANGVQTGLQPEGLRILMLDKLLGRILAHELGHVLLNSSAHAESGLMRARYQATDVVRVPASAYTLDPFERARLYTVLGERTRLAAR
jgi:hypothetical protein